MALERESIPSRKYRLYPKHHAKYPRGAKHYGAKLTERMVVMIRQKVALGSATQQEMAREHHVSECTISRIINRLAWTHC